ncbi:unnamed protein product [Adineta ricciae]|uniref:Mitochondrial ATPase inhibitor n=1 Tax=Adineta ricciae TaxID=249248 RepID=A0A814LC86_ADIRI|nr:unnamed protein product [Adineta ricciae]CAF1607116.1 unnamed protein product [Adineta ricciae]
MYRALTSSSQTLAQRVVRSTLTFTRLSSTDPEAGSVSGQDAFNKREKAEESRWARRFEAEQAEKYRSSKGAQSGGQKQAGRQSPAGGSNQQRLAELEAEKRRIDQEIADLKRQKR